MRFLLLLALLVASGVQAAAIERFKSFVRTTQSARADFEQKVYDRDRKLVQQAKGSFVLLRPGRFRWVYDKPVDQLIVGDGEIELADGTTIKGQADFGKGSPANPMTFEEASTKFRGCAEYAGCPKAKAEKIIAFVKSLDTASDVSALWPLLSGDKS